MISLSYVYIYIFTPSSLTNTELRTAGPSCACLRVPVKCKRAAALACQPGKASAPSDPFAPGRLDQTVVWRHQVSFKLRKLADQPAGESRRRTRVWLVGRQSTSSRDLRRRALGPAESHRDLSGRETHSWGRC